MDVNVEIDDSALIELITESSDFDYAVDQRVSEMDLADSEDLNYLSREVDEYGDRIAALNDRITPLFETLDGLTSLVMDQQKRINALSFALEFAGQTFVDSAVEEVALPSALPLVSEVDPVEAREAAESDASPEPQDVAGGYPPHMLSSKP